MTTALSVDNVSKQYRIYAKPADRLKESLTRGRLKRHQEFWALKDVGFEIEKGTTTGIIGPNGSGKSTLLQIITGTLNPTQGNVYYDGRVAALLELGAGFNPEFTGLENVFMNSSLLGFSRKQTEKLLPEIERFAEIGPFIYQPVKTYSSGMYVRLAFSIAVAADPEILIVDEALAVGDAVFQHRCLRRIKEMQERGTTILFVSHDPAAIRYLCSRAMLLNAGRVIADGDPMHVLNRYQKLIMEREEAFDGGASGDEPKPESRPIERGELTYTYRHGDQSAEFVSIDLLDARHNRVEIVDSGEPLVLRMRILFNRNIENPIFGFLIRSQYGIQVYGTNTEQQQVSFNQVERGEIVEIDFAFDCALGTDWYSISCAAHSSTSVSDGVSYDWLDGALFFRVTSPILIEGLVNLNASATARTFRSSTVAV